VKILVTGATGYIGKRLIPILVESGHFVVCCVRDINRFNPDDDLLDSIEVIEVDFLAKDSLLKIPKDIDAAYYLIHSMSSSSDYDDMEALCAINFCNAINLTKVNQVIYLSGIANDQKLSKHLKSRKNVENILIENSFNLTTLRAGIIIGSGSASFEIIRDLVEKLPVMIAPRWLSTKCQPIGIRNVIQFLLGCLGNSETYNKDFDIGGPDILTYKQMLIGYAKFRKLKRRIITVPIMTPRLSSYWLYFVTSTSYNLAKALVNSMKVEVVCRDNKINEILNIKTEPYQKALSRAFEKIANNEILSSWKDAQASGVKSFSIAEYINVPEYGCFKDVKQTKFDNRKKVIDNVWSLGGDKGWYHANFLWKLRGYMDKLFGGVGLRRGRTNSTSLEPGDALDFWRVLYANKNDGRLLLFAEMKLPGEAWLEFKVNKNHIIQTATFRPHGILGRMYWYAVLPFHGIVFNGMIKKLAHI